MKKATLAVPVILVVVVGVIGYVSFTNRPAAPNSTDQPTPNTERSAPASGSSLNLSGRSLTSVPKNLLDNALVTALDVSNNQLTGALPAEIRKLSNLEVLNASDNKMTGIPAEIGQLRQLKTANFSNNNISGLPLEIGNLQNLKTLDLRRNPALSKHDLELIRQKLPNTTILID